jgi:hypothetical protein
MGFVSEGAPEGERAVDEHYSLPVPGTIRALRLDPISASTRLLLKGN